MKNTGSAQQQPGQIHYNYNVLISTGGLYHVESLLNICIHKDESQHCVVFSPNATAQQTIETVLFQHLDINYLRKDIKV